MIKEIKRSYNEENNVLDICEIIFMRKIEIHLCLHIMKRTEKQCNKLLSESNFAA